MNRNRRRMRKRRVARTRLATEPEKVMPLAEVSVLDRLLALMMPTEFLFFLDGNLLWLSLT